jgi:hypothetical protein
MIDKDFVLFGLKQHLKDVSHISFKAVLTFK